MSRTIIRTILACLAAAACLGSNCLTIPAPGTGFPKTTEWQSQTVSNAAARRPTAVLAADVDADGRLDVIAGYAGTAESEPGVFILFRQNASGFTFNAVQIGTGANFNGVAALAASDIDGDGRLDVVAACNGRIMHLRNTGDVRQAAAWTATELAQSSGDGLGPWTDVAVADIDGADRPDLFACNSTPGRLSWFRAPVDATSGTGWTRVDIDAANRAGATSLAAGDINGDGRIDVASTAPGQPTARIAWYANPADPAASPWPMTAIGNLENATRLSLADLDRDGDADALAINPTGRQVGWYVRPADPTQPWSGFQLTMFTSNRPADAKAADLDGNGQIDVVVATANAGALRWFTPVAAATDQWTENHLIDLVDNPVRLALGDFDANGRPDVVASLNAANPADDQVAWFRNPQ